MVKKEYEGKKIGIKIMKLLLEKIEEYKDVNPDLRVYLGISKGKENFYEKFGFVRRSSLDLGEGMILE